MRTIPNLLSRLPARLALYVFLEAVGLQVIVVNVKNAGPAIFDENGLIEWIQFGLMIAAGSVFLWTWRQNSDYPSALLMCGTFSFVAALRELDHFSEILLFEDAYKYVSALFIVLALYRLGRERRRLQKDIERFMKQPAFLILGFGLFLTVLLAQILGQAELWQALIQTSSGRSAKRFLEETLETGGYLILFFGSIEVFIQSTQKGNRS